MMSEIKYRTVHELVRYQLKSKLKVPRPLSIKQNQRSREEFKKQLDLKIKEKLDEVEKQNLNYQQIRYWCEDETRIGLKTITGRLLTGKGVKPIGKHQWLFKYFWIYGLIEPQTGESFYDEFCHLDTVCMERFLELFSEKYPRGKIFEHWQPLSVIHELR